jgi:hypothetical protein
MFGIRHEVEVVNIYTYKTSWRAMFVIRHEVEVDIFSG